MRWLILTLAVIAAVKGTHADPSECALAIEAGGSGRHAIVSCGEKWNCFARSFDAEGVAHHEAINPFRQRGTQHASIWLRPESMIIATECWPRPPLSTKGTCLYEVTDDGSSTELAWWTDPPFKPVHRYELVPSAAPETAWLVWARTDNLWAAQISSNGSCLTEPRIVSSGTVATGMEMGTKIPQWGFAATARPDGALTLAWPATSRQDGFKLLARTLDPDGTLSAPVPIAISSRVPLTNPEMIANDENVAVIWHGDGIHAAILDRENNVRATHQLTDAGTARKGRITQHGGVFAAGWSERTDQGNRVRIARFGLDGVMDTATSDFEAPNEYCDWTLQVTESKAVVYSVPNPEGEPVTVATRAIPFEDR